MDDLLKNLNPMQKEAVLTTEGPLLLLAGAGSGKTRVLVHRMAFLVEQGVDPYNILAITFTNKAAREMKERVSTLAENGEAIWVSTFHSMCVRILRREISRLGYGSSFTIYDTDDSEKLMKAVIREQDLNEKIFTPKSVLNIIGRQKDELIGAEDFAKLYGEDFKMRIIGKLYAEYQKKLRQANALDFDDIIFRTVELFATWGDVLGRYQERFVYISVDEYQDTNTAQYQLVRLLSAKHGNLCVVGDDDQSIYGWRGANINNILDFEKDFPNAVTIKLEQNYRSTGIILDAANAVIRNNKSRKSKRLWTEKTDGSPVRLHRADSDIEEADFVVESMASGLAEGLQYRDFAVLYRTNAQSRIIEDRFVKNSVPYRIFGGVRFYERREIKDVMAYLKVIYNPLDDIALKRIVNVPRRGIGDTTLEKIGAYAVKNELPFIDALRGIDKVMSSSRNKNVTAFVELFDSLRNTAEKSDVETLIREILERTGYKLELQSDRDENSEDRVNNVMELVSKAAEFDRSAEVKGLAVFLEEVSLVADIDNYNESDDAAVLMTLHSSKGLEFPVVFITGAEEGIFPGYMAAASGDPKNLEEERRLCYVGITRAKNELYITSAVSRRQHGQMVYNAPSRFLKEIPAELVCTDRPERKKSKPDDGSVYVPKPSPGLCPPAAEMKNSYAPVINTKINKESLDFVIGDSVLQQRYGIGVVTEIRPAGADFEVTVEFPEIGRKKFMAHLSKLVKQS